MLPFQQAVENEFSEVNKLIVSQLHSDVGLVENIGHYIIDAGGKRLRPVVVLLSALANGYQGVDHLKMAAVIEFIHTATLLHDDVVDVAAVGLALELGNELRHHLALVTQAGSPHFADDTTRSRHYLFAASLLGKVFPQHHQFRFLYINKVLPVSLPKCFNALLALPGLFGDYANDIGLLQGRPLGNFHVMNGRKDEPDDGAPDGVTGFHGILQVTGQSVFECLAQFTAFLAATGSRLALTLQF